MLQGELRSTMFRGSSRRKAPLPWHLPSKAPTSFAAGHGNDVRHIAQATRAVCLWSRCLWRSRIHRHIHVCHPWQPPHIVIRLFASRHTYTTTPKRGCQTQAMCERAFPLLTTLAHLQSIHTRRHTMGCMMGACRQRCALRDAWTHALKGSQSVKSRLLSLS